MDAVFFWFLLLSIIVLNNNSYGFYPQAEELDESESSKLNCTVKEKPAIQRRRVFRSITSLPSHSTSPPHHISDDAFVSTSTIGYQCSESLSHSSSPSLYYNVTASLPSNFNPKSYQKRPVPKPRTVSLNRVDASDVNVESSLPKVNNILSNIHKIHKASTYYFICTCFSTFIWTLVQLIHKLNQNEYLL